MSAALPQNLDPWRAAQAHVGFAGSATLAELPRLAEVVVGADSPASYSLRFELDAEGRAVVLGRVTLAVRFICQRCLGELQYRLDVPIAWALSRFDVESDALGHADVPGIADRLEPLSVGGDLIHPLELIEDELLLAIPLVPMHEAGECQAEISAVLIDDGIGETDVSKNPFAILAALKSGCQT